MMTPARQQTGFTLIEMITVIVLLAIIGAIGTGFIITTLDAYTQTQERTKLINRSRQALEQMTRQLRGAAPNSIRVTNGGNCVEFLPLAGGGNYLAPVPDASNGAAASNTIATAPFSIDFGIASYVSIGSRVPADYYNGGSLATLASFTATQLNLAAATVWGRNSATRRFFLLDDPQAFCLAAGNLSFFSNYSTPLATNGSPPGNGVLMAENVSSNSPFTLDAGSETRGAVVIIDLLFSENNQQVPLRQEVFVRNVP